MRLNLWIAIALSLSVSAAQTPPRAQVKTAKITVLSTMLADQGFGEWGFAALVETGGLLTLREDSMKRNAKALSHAYVAKGIFYPRAANGLLALRDPFVEGGGSFTEIDAPREIYPGVWLTGPVPRKYPERNFTMNGRAGTVTLPDGSTAEDNVPEDQSLVLNTAQGLVVLSGCGHSGIVNTLVYARSSIRDVGIHAVLGGFHLFQADDKTLAWTGGKLRAMKVANFLGAHCTGIEAVYKLREAAGLTRRTCSVGAVGATFTLEGGLSPGRISQ